MEGLFAVTKKQMGFLQLVGHSSLRHLMTVNFKLYLHLLFLHTVTAAQFSTLKHIIKKQREARLCLYLSGSTVRRHKGWLKWSLIKVGFTRLSGIFP